MCCPCPQRTLGIRLPSLGTSPFPQGPEQTSAGHILQKCQESTDNEGSSRVGTEPKVEKKCPLPTVPLSASVVGEAGFVVKERNRLKVGTGPVASPLSDLWG